MHTALLKFLIGLCLCASSLSAMMVDAPDDAAMYRQRAETFLALAAQFPDDAEWTRLHTQLAKLYQRMAAWKADAAGKTARGEAVKGDEFRALEAEETGMRDELSNFLKKRLEKGGNANQPEPGPLVIPDEIQ
jgi:hypothetical protein